MEQQLQASFATILIYGIYADNIVSKKETNLFCTLMHNNFNLSEQDSLDLLNDTHPTQKDMEYHVDKVNGLLENKPREKMHLLEYLNHIIYADGIKPVEYKVFEDLRRKLFPQTVN